jgi:DNA-binding transcriptional regulator YhcF (GntR family)
MTEKIQHIIDGIRLKCKVLYSQLESERALRTEHEAELSTIKNDYQLLKDEKIIFEETISKLKSELELIEKQRVEEKQASLIDRNEEIDDLVREIEHCIKQLK